MATNALKCAQYLLDRGIDRTVTNSEGKLSHEMVNDTHYDDLNHTEIKTLIRNYEDPPTTKGTVDN